MKLRKLLALVMAGAMCLALLTACGGGGDSGNSQAPAASPSDSAAPAPSDAAPAGEKGGTGETFTMDVSNHDSEISKGAQYMKDLTDMMSAYLSSVSTDSFDFQIYNGGSLYGGAECVDGVASGGASFAWGAAAFYSGRFPISEFIQLPLNGINSAQMGSKVFQDMLAEIPELADEYAGLRIIQLQGNCPGILSTTKEYGKIEKPEDLNGLQFRTAGTTAGLWVSAVGMVPVTVATSDTYEYLEKDIVNGCMNDWHNIDCFKLYEVIGYCMDYCVATSPCFVIMNQDQYDSLPVEAQNAIDLYSGAYASDMAGWYWDTCYFTTGDMMKENGVEIYKPNDELLAFMTSDDIKNQVHQEYIDYLNGFGLDGQGIYDKCMEIVSRYADQYANVYDTRFAIEDWANSDVAQADLAANAEALGITLG